MPVVYGAVNVQHIGINTYHFFVVRIEALFNEWKLLLSKSFLDLY